MAFTQRFATAVVAGGLAVGLASCSMGSDLGFQDLQAGQCYDESGVNLEADTNVMIIQFEEADCSKPHQVEAIAVMPIDLVAYDEAAILDGLETRCDDAFLAYVGIDAAQSEHFLYFDWPSEKQWDTGIHSGVCLVTDLGGAMEGSIAGTAS
jgi:hypothetical protein